MVFSSITFLFYFLPIFLVLYYLSDRKYKNILILLASILFYAWGAPKFIFVLLGSTFLDFYLVRWMSQQRTGRKKRVLLAVSILLNVGLLAYFKYANFFVENINVVLSSLGSEPVPWAEVLLPIGISFYTFQTLTYSMDVYRGLHRPLDSVWDYMLYIIMFPQLIAGPIVRFGHIAGQITERRERIDDCLYGMYRFSIGLGKKVLIANVLGSKASEVFGMEDFSQLDTPTAWIGILAFTFQIYFDFSGYSDMAIGLGRMMGFSFPENFDNPYTSRSISEFWRRWHITLGQWMKDYLYIPLGGNQVSSNTRLYFNLWLVFLISGLWHGASWNFMLWGAYHGFFLVAERLFLKDLLPRLGSFGSWAYCFFFSVLGWGIFKIEDVGQAWSYYKRLFIFEMKGDMGIVLDSRFLVAATLAVFFSFFLALPYGKKIHDAVFQGNFTLSGHLMLWSASCMILFLSVGALSTTGFNPFIYFRF